MRISLKIKDTKSKACISKNRSIQQILQGEEQQHENNREKTIQ
jgi:hypothetical protein